MLVEAGRIGVARRVHRIVKREEFPDFWWGVSACGWAGQMFPEMANRITCQACLRQEGNSPPKP